MKTLYLVRHAKSSWKNSALSDHERPLNQRGLRNAPQMGQRLKQAGVQVERMIASPALRALTTARLLAAEIGFPAGRIEQNEILYFSAIMPMLELIQQTAQPVNSLMLVGHNPDMTALLNLLSRCDIDNMPTCAIATLQFDTDWAELKTHLATLVDYDYPKKI